MSVLAVQQVLDRRNLLFTATGAPKHVGPRFPYFKGFWIGSSMEFPLTIFTMPIDIYWISTDMIFLYPIMLFFL